MGPQGTDASALSISISIAISIPGCPQPSVVISSRVLRPEGDTDRLDDGHVCTQGSGLSSHFWN